MGNNQPNPDNDPLARALNSDYTFSIKSILGRANSQLNRNFGAMLQGTVILFLALVALSMVLALTFDISTPEAITPLQRLLFQVIGVFVMAPLQTGLYMMGASAARGNKPKGLDVFAYTSGFFVLALAQLMVSVVTQLGLGLLIVPGVYLWVATVFTLPLVADKGLRPLSALVTSVRVVNRFIGPMLGLMGILLLLFATAIPTYGLSLIWVLPFYFSTIGVLYTDIFSAKTTSPVIEQSSEESRFDA